MDPEEAVQKAVNYYHDLTPHTKSFVHSFAVVSLAKILVAPFEVLRFIAQTQPERFSSEALQPWKKRWRLTSRQSKARISMLIMEEGSFSLWRGILPNILKFFPQLWVRTNFKTPIEKSLMPRKSTSTGYLEHLGRVYFTATIVALLAHTVTYPLEVIRTRLATDYKAQLTPDATPRRQYPFGRAILTMFKDEGPTVFFKGFFFSTFSVVPYLALYYGSYDLFKLLFVEGPEPIANDYTASGAAAALAMTVAYPMDTIRRNLMKSGQANHNHLRINSDFAGAVHCARFMNQEYGWRGFYRGFGYNIYRAATVALLVPILEHEQQRYLNLE